VLVNGQSDRFMQVFILFTCQKTAAIFQYVRSVNKSACVLSVYGWVKV